nr:hypothetical protein Iba_chr02cCG1830 [Ipomoea batatas]
MVENALLQGMVKAAQTTRSINADFKPLLPWERILVRSMRSQHTELVALLIATLLLPPSKDPMNTSSSSPKPIIRLLLKLRVACRISVMENWRSPSYFVAEALVFGGFIGRYSMAQMARFFPSSTILSSSAGLPVSTSSSTTPKA